jgi:cytochrome c biogenesis protein CcmG, thiol:disulfide interchange protein DsbE
MSIACYHSRAMQQDSRDPGKLLFSLSIALIVAGLLLGFAVLPRTFAPREAAIVGKDAPEVTLAVVHSGTALPDGATTLSLRQLRGHPVVLDFFATWCGPCRVEAPLVDRISRRYKDHGLVVVGVNTSDEEGLAAPFATSRGLSFPIAFDEASRVAHAYGVESLPTLVVIDKTGKVIAVRTGVTGDAELERLVAQVL